MNFDKCLLYLLPLLLAVLNAGTSRAEQPSLPQLSPPIADGTTSHAFLAAAHLKRPIDLAEAGYLEQEYLVSGSARVFDWPDRTGGAPEVLAQGPYTTRILVRRPRDARRFNGTAIVEPLNPSSVADAPIMWAESFEYFMAQGYAWIGVTVKPNTIKSLKTFDPVRYARVAMPNPHGTPRCAPAEINPLSQPTTPGDETGLAWDMLSQIGALLKSASRANPLGQAAQRLYMTGQSQTAGYSRTYASVFGLHTEGPNGKPLFDAYLYSGSPPWQVPLNQCRKDLESGDPRLITPPARVPIIELFAQGDLGTNVETRRPDADTPADRFRRYEVAGASHVDPWEQLSFASDEDMHRIVGGAQTIAVDPSCTPKDVPPSDFPVRYVFNGAWNNLDNWVRQGVAPPHAKPLQLETASAPFVPDQAFVVDEFGNALGGVRTPYVDVPTARWIGARTGGFRCMFFGYKIPFDSARLKALYGDHATYVDKVRASASRLAAQRWLTRTDADAIVQEAEQANVP